MDFFGIAAQVQGAVRVAFQSARGTGRTTNLIKSLKDGDRVVCASSGEARHLERLAKDWGLDVQCTVVHPRDDYKLHQYGTAQGRTLFDHGWLEQYYLHRLEQAANAINNLEKHLSGWDERHVETRRRAQEIAKWGGLK